MIIIACFANLVYGQQGQPSPETKNTADASRGGEAMRSDSATVSAQDSGAAGSDAAGPAVNNAPAVEQMTSSQSGSPSVLSGDRGGDRDGTNNVQRASINMAGSPVRNLDIDDERTVDPDTEMQDRQEYTQEKQLSAQGEGETAGGDAAGTSGTSGEANKEEAGESTRIREDDNVSGEEKERRNKKRG